MDIQELDESIKVGAVFNGNNIVPRWFIWEKRKYQIEKINYEWQDKNGKEKLFCFSVISGANTYEITFNAERTVWRLCKLCADT